MENASGSNFLDTTALLLAAGLSQVPVMPPKISGDVVS
jgi:hypothetical protein